MARIWRIVNRGPASTRAVFALAHPDSTMPTITFASQRPLQWAHSHAFVVEGTWESGAAEDLTIHEAGETTYLFRTFSADDAGSADRLIAAAATAPTEVAQLRRTLEAGIPADPWPQHRRFFARLSERDHEAGFLPVLERMVPSLGERIVDRAAYARQGLRTGTLRAAQDFGLRNDVLACLDLIRSTVAEVFGQGDSANDLLDRAFELFVAGQLAVLHQSVKPGTERAPDVETVTIHGAPNSVLFLYFAELLLLANDLRIARSKLLLPWFRSFVRTAHAFVELYWDHSSRTLSAYEWRHRSPLATSFPWEPSRAQFSERDWETLEEDFSRLCLFALSDTMRRTRPFHPHWS